MECSTRDDVYFWMEAKMTKCLCNAESAEECVCGGWDEIDATEAYNEENIHEDEYDEEYEE